MPRAALAALVLAAALPASAQWTNRYPSVPGYSHHVYLEGYELPTVAAGPTDPAPSPDGRRVALAARGWLWLLDLDTRAARRVTSGPALDARPAWSADGRSLAFVRDDGQETAVVTLDLATGTERVVAEAPGLELDPTFAPDGALLYAAAGDRGIGLRRLDPATGAASVVTDAPGIAVAPRWVGDDRVLYVAKRGSDEVRLRRLDTGDERVVHRGAILSQTRPAVSPDGREIALALPLDDGWELAVAGLDAHGPTLRLVGGAAPPLGPRGASTGTSTTSRPTAPSGCG